MGPFSRAGTLRQLACLIARGLRVNPLGLSDFSRNVPFASFPWNGRRTLEQGGTTFP